MDSTRPTRKRMAITSLEVLALKQISLIDFRHRGIKKTTYAARQNVRIVQTSSQLGIHIEGRTLVRMT